jgi:Polyketide cyclase / dehydrase and lipid transport
MNIPTAVDRSAPVIAHHEVDIQAPLDTVWRLHTDINAWPTWQTDITAAHLDGLLEPGASFDWTTYGLSVTSTVYDLAEGARVLWGGTANGITGVHEWLFSETPAGVHVTTNESFAGEPVKADAVGMQSLLDASLVSWLGHLKAAAESRA